MAQKPTQTARPTADGVDPQAPDPVAPNAPLSNDNPNRDDSKALPGNGATAEVEMVEVKTKEPVMLMDPFSGYHITEDGAKVPVTSFINDELAEGGRLEKA